MREILFRGKCPYTLKWILGDYVLIEGEAGIKIRGEVPYFPILPDTIGQFTGLKDKNGEMIFEGDIVCFYEFPSSHRRIYFDEFLSSHHRIYFDVDNARWTDEIIEDGDTCTDYYGFDFVKDSTIIGNIHDNPELIKV